MVAAPKALPTRRIPRWCPAPARRRPPEADTSPKLPGGVEKLDSVLCFHIQKETMADPTILQPIASMLRSFFAPPPAMRHVRVHIVSASNKDPIRLEVIASRWRPSLVGGGPRSYYVSHSMTLGGQFTSLLRHRCRHLNVLALNAHLDCSFNGTSFGEATSCLSAMKCGGMNKFVSHIRQTGHR